MQLRNYPKDDGKMVWLSLDEVDRLISVAGDTRRTMAISLGARCGLRASEIVDVTPTDIVETEAGWRVRVWHGKGDKYRETPAPENLVHSIQAFADVGELEPDDELVDCTTRTLERWVHQAANRLRAEERDEGWKFVTPHDLRRSWGTLLVEADVEPGIIMEWGGWEDWETFREHYLGAYSMKKQKQEQAKVSWL